MDIDYFRLYVKDLKYNTEIYIDEIEKMAQKIKA